MRVTRAIAWALVVLGVASLAYAGLQGQLDVFLVLVVPVVTGSGPAAALAMLATIAGVLGLLWTSARRMTGGPGGSRSPDPGSRPQASADSEPGERRTKGGGVILLGPIPIAWGSDRSTLGWLLVGAIVLTVAAIGLTLVLRL